MMQKILLVLLVAPAVLAFTSPAASTTTTTTSISDNAAMKQSTRLFAANDGDDDEGEKKAGGLFAGVSNFFSELDAFVDDASARRLGAGASFYGKRKSSFYGKNDSMKKADKDTYDPTEDYRVTAGGNYKWMEDEDGVLRPVTRLKNKIMERD